MKLQGDYMRSEIIVESVAVGLTTLGIGSALMLVRVQNKWWPFIGTFLVGFLAHMGFEITGLNEKFCKKIIGDN